MVYWQHAQLASNNSLHWGFSGLYSIWLYHPMDERKFNIDYVFHIGRVLTSSSMQNRFIDFKFWYWSFKVWDLSFKSYWSGASCKVTMIGHMHTVRCLQVMFAHKSCAPNKQETYNLSFFFPGIKTDNICSLRGQSVCFGNQLYPCVLFNVDAGILDLRGTDFLLLL